MKRNEGERRGWALVATSLLIGLLCVIAAGDMAIRLAPGWRLEADMRSRLSPDSIFLTPRSDSIFQPLDPAILTPPIWINVFLTPGQNYPTRLPRPTATPTNPAPPAQASPTAIPITASPTSTIAYFPATQPTNPGPTRTSNPPAFTATATLPPSLIPTGTLVPLLTPSNTPIPQADLQITMSDGVVVYSAGGPLTYTVIVSNNGPANVDGALISDPIRPQVLNWTWTCTSQNNGASGCDPAGGNTANFSDTVSLPYGASIVYTVVVNTRPDAAGSLVHTASIAAPADVVDPAIGNNTVTDSNDFLNSLPYGNIGTDPNYAVDVLPPGASLAFRFDTPVVVNGHPSWDVVLYELPNGSGVAMDVMIFQIGDGASWYTVFTWGDNIADTNSNLDISVVGGQENDNRDFTYVPISDILYPFNSGTDANPATGIVFELDGVVPNGAYPYFRIISPAAGDVDGGCEIDAVTVLQ